MTETFQHISVLLNESIDGLAIKPDGIYIDGTFGRGGHSRTILSKLGENGRLYSIDRDPTAIAEANKIDDPRFTIIHTLSLVLLSMQSATNWSVKWTVCCWILESLPLNWMMPNAASAL